MATLGDCGFPVWLAVVELSRRATSGTKARLTKVKGLSVGKTPCNGGTDYEHRVGDVGTWYFQMAAGAPPSPCSCATASDLPVIP